MNSIHFSGRHRFLDGNARKKIRLLLKTIAETKGQKIVDLNYVFLHDDELLEINMEHLNHNTYTDIITFDLSEGESNGIEGEIYISTDRVKENSVLHKSNETHELIRVISHGLLHLLGYKDKKPADTIVMRTEEEVCLSLWDNI
jgi:probable rRNA maturation factor